MITTLSAVPGIAEGSRNRAAIGAAEMWLDEITELYLLAFILTADKETAEQCVLDSVDGYLDSGAVSLVDWVKSDGRHAAITSAVKRLKPRVKASYSWTVPDGTRAVSAPSHQPFAVITALGTFERFVYVLSVLEGYDEEECADVLQCHRAEVVAARKLSQQLVGLSETEEASLGRLDPLLVVNTAVHSRCGIS